ncbi:GNAT family N-acetyltransferase [Tenacibaculum tangerinum]|uniref:GNAT family N-acetyltransferase n=1 Tax=Tenacibaculum tangerinum TaxID=3038772 RepID=A0ABY8L395_9FLAO|nr:GNAT family N-acetyltransferase [Tenacibaculum tangerinum]WGH75739.1 GNAT family N-acetyltransferase [Tenacibaculum tangerinum]
MGTFITTTDAISIAVISDEIRYFSLLSEEWKKLIVPVWRKYSAYSTIYGLFVNSQLMGGGILFNEMPPYATLFEKNNAVLFQKGYLYLGYVWIVENYRNKGYASTFLSLLKKEKPNQKFWLTIEEENLRYFYEQNGFKMFAESDGIKTTKEWILIYDN